MERNSGSRDVNSWECVSNCTYLTGMHCTTRLNRLSSVLAVHGLCSLRICREFVLRRLLER
jgi:hypothetical protein